MYKPSPEALAGLAAVRYLVEAFEDLVAGLGAHSAAGVRNLDHQKLGIVGRKPHLNFYRATGGSELHRIVDQDNQYLAQSGRVGGDGGQT